MNKVAFEGGGGGGGLKLGKDNDKLTHLGKNNAKKAVYHSNIEVFWAKQRIILGKNYENLVYRHNLEAFGSKTTHKSMEKIMMFCNFMHPCHFSSGSTPSIAIG